MKMLTGKDVLKSFAIGNTGQPAILNLSTTIWQALPEASASYPEISTAIYLEATA